MRPATLAGPVLLGTPKRDERRLDFGQLLVREVLREHRDVERPAVAAVRVDSSADTV